MAPFSETPGKIRSKEEERRENSRENEKKGKGKKCRGSFANSCHRVNS